MVRTPFPGSTSSKASVAALTLCLAAAAFASPAAAAEARARLIRCGAQSCLLITGHRDDPASVVSVNDRAVPVEGKHGWRLALPVEAVRLWSAPFARAVEVTLHDRVTGQETTQRVSLPIGLLGNVTDLAFLEVSAN